jgi:hypothetical protein
MMAIIGFSFTKINAEKTNTAVKGGVSISNNASITGIREIGISLGKQKQPTLGFAFSYTSQYEPKIGSITLEGEVLYLQEQKKLNEITEHWAKTKKLPLDITPMIMNSILSKCNLQVLILARDLNLPSPLPLPKMKTPQKK